MMFFDKFNNTTSLAEGLKLSPTSSLRYVSVFVLFNSGLKVSFNLPVVFLLSSPFPTQCKAAVTTVGSEKPSTFFTVRSTHGLNSSTSRFGRDILQSCKTQHIAQYMSNINLSLNCLKAMKLICDICACFFYICYH